MTYDNTDTLSALAKDILTYIRQEHTFTPAEVKKAPTPSAPKVKAEIKSIIAKEPPLHPTPQKEDSQLRQLIERALPELHITDKIPSDAKAKALAQLYKKKSPQVGLLSFDPEQLGFLKALAKAIHEKLAPAKIWEASKFEQTEGLRLIIATNAGIESLPELKAHLKESPQPMLFGIPLILLAPLTEYDNNPSLKRALWTHLCQTLQ